MREPSTEIETGSVIPHALEVNCGDCEGGGIGDLFFGVGFCVLEMLDE
jgi:hypothetical protein